MTQYVRPEHTEFMGMPVNQTNAYLPPELMMRVGIPHRGGGLAMHAFNEEFPAMLSANAFWNADKQCFHFPEYTNLSELDFALDSAGFTAMKLWKTKGPQRGIAEVYPWTLSEYLEFASRTGASWYAQPDFCCEPEIAANQHEIDYRINATATMLEMCLRTLYEWQNELSKTCNAVTVANMLRPPVPVVQGWSANDYLRSLDLLVQVWDRWTPWLALPTLIGVGSVCRRSLKHPVHGLFAILAALEPQLPESSRVHLFGVKGGSLSKLKMHDWVASADSMAYDLGARFAARKAGVSNTIQHRSAEMSRWMDTNGKHTQPAAGDQFRLPMFA